MKNLLIASLLLVGCVAPLTAQEGHDHDHASHWVADFDKAVEAAKAAKKDLFVDFTGSDWCGWCIRLHKEVFDHHEFLDEIGKTHILVALDFPRSEEAKAKVPNAQRNDELNKKYDIKGYPSILLMTTEGVVYARTGYQAGGPKAYVDHLKEISQSGKKRLAGVEALTKEFEKAEDKAAILGKALDMLGEVKDSDEAGSGALVALAKKALTGSDEALRLKAVTVILKSGHGDDEVMGMAEKLDPKNEKGLMEQVVKAKVGKVGGKDDLEPAVKAIDALVAMGPIKDKELAPQLYANAAFWNHQFLKNEEGAKKYAKMLKEIAGDDPRFKRLLEMIEK